jgi:two-component system chemotaxis response regulator CheB
MAQNGGNRPMPRIRVLVIDNSSTARRLISEGLAAEPTLEVVGVAANGSDALERIAQINPDLVTLDVALPEMGGLQTLSAIRESYPHLPVIMLSTLTERAARVTLEALALGATDYATKPLFFGSANGCIARMRNEIVPKIKALCAGVATEIPQALPALAVPARRPTKSLLPPRPVFQSHPAAGIVAISVSTGGPGALAELMRFFPADFPVPIVIVQHMPPIFTRLLADRLTAQSLIKVKEGVRGARLGPGVAWIAPGNHHMVVERNGVNVVLNLHQGPPENFCRPAVDVLFRSVAEVYGAAIVAVVLTGMGRDGLRGCQIIQQRGGHILAQDEATSIVWGMPGLVARTGLAEKVLPLNQLSDEIMHRVVSRPVTNARPH